MNTAWFKKAGFVVTVLADLAAIGVMDLSERSEAGCGGLVAAESGKAKHLEPVRMAIAGQ